MLAIVEAAGFAIDADIDDADVVRPLATLPASHAGAQVGYGALFGHVRCQCIQIERFHPLAGYTHRVQFEFGLQIGERQHTG